MNQSGILLDMINCYIAIKFIGPHDALLHIWNENIVRAVCAEEKHLQDHPTSQQPHCVLLIETPEKERLWPANCQTTERASVQ